MDQRNFVSGGAKSGNGELSFVSLYANARAHHPMGIRVMTYVLSPSELFFSLPPPTR